MENKIIAKNSNASVIITHSAITRRGQKRGSLEQASPHFIFKRFDIYSFNIIGLITKGIWNKTHFVSISLTRETHFWRFRREVYIDVSLRYMLDDLCLDSSKYSKNSQNSAEVTSISVSWIILEKFILDDTRPLTGGEC